MSRPPSRRCAVRSVLAVALLAGVASTHAEDGEYGAYLATIDGLRDPTAVAVGPDGRIHVAEAGAGRIGVFDATGARLRDLVPIVNDTPLLRSPSGVAVGADGFVYVTEAVHDRVVVLNASGAVRRTWGLRGSGPGQFNRPAGIAVAGERVIVADRGNHRVQVFDTDGKQLFMFGEPGRGAGAFRHPIAVAAGGDDLIVVADAGNNRIQTFDGRGRPLAAWGDWGSFPGLFSTPTGVAVHDGQLFVTDRLSHRAQVFDLDGTFRYQWGVHAVKPREGEGKIHYPEGVAVAPDGSFVAVVEPFEDRVQVFGRKAPEADGRRGFVVPPPRGQQNHFGRDLAVSGTLLAVSEPETRSVVLFDIRNEVPILISSFGGAGPRFGQFGVVGGLIVDGARPSVLAGDEETGRIQRFDLDYDPEQRISFKPLMARFARAGRPLAAWGGSARPVEPVAMDRDGAGLLYVVDAATARVVVFDDDYVPVRGFGGRGADGAGLLDPVDLSIDRERRRLYVADRGDRRVKVFDLDGSFLSSFGGPDRFESPAGVVAARDGSVYVTDARRHDVQRFDTEGRFVTAWGKRGGGPGEFWKPADIVQDDRLRLIVVDYGNHRMQIFSPDGRWLVTFGAGRAYTRENPPAGFEVPEE